FSGLVQVTATRVVAEDSFAIYLATNDWICANLSSHGKDTKVEVFLAWDFPPVGWWKLNTNGCRKGEEGIIGTGRLIRNVNGDLDWWFLC
ncbi:unnamed protein product, partial [Prunus brigantina]